VRRVPSGFLHARSWRVEQPGRPEIAGRSHWATWNPLALLWKMLVAFLASVVTVVDFFLEGSSEDLPRKLVWRTGLTVVATSHGSRSFDVRAGWIDPRLMFAFAVIGDWGQTPSGPPADGGRRLTALPEVRLCRSRCRRS
jgi:hypothetical protein